MESTQAEQQRENNFKTLRKVKESPGQHQMNKHLCYMGPRAREKEAENSSEEIRTGLV